MLKSLFVGTVGMALGACGPQQFVITMAELNSSGQTGTATVSDFGDHFTVDVSITPHPVEDGPQLIHIHPNRCGNILNPILQLQSLVDGKSVTTVVGSFSDYRHADHAFNAHLSSDPSVYVSCGNIPPL